MKGVWQYGDHEKQLLYLSQPTWDGEGEVLKRVHFDRDLQQEEEVADMLLLPPGTTPPPHLLALGALDRALHLSLKHICHNAA